MAGFVESVLLRSTAGAAYVCTLPNVRGEGISERHVLTRDPDKIQTFCKKWDQAGRGLFYCVGSIHERKPRRKESYAQSTFLHADVDFKSIACTADEARAALMSLPLPPSRLHGSGNGLHALWLLREPTSDADAVEAALKKVCDAVAGDRLVTHVVALMRMPGSHNTKEGAWREVEVLHDSDRTYSFEELAASFDRAAIPRRDREEADSNPFTRTASVLSFKPAMDPEEALAAMGEGSIHSTQLSVSASLLSAGWPPGEVVARILAETRRAGDPSWDWAREERTIRSMCDDWLEKHPQEKSKRAASGEVVSLADKREEKVSTKVPKAKSHAVLAAGLVASLDQRGEKLLFSEGRPWLYSGGLWRDMRPEEWKSWSAGEVEIGCRTLRIVSTTKVVNETRALLERDPDLRAEDVPWDEHGKIATRSGLVDFKTLEHEAYRWDHYATHSVECAFDAGATCPMWRQMLTDVGFDAETRDVLQEVFGTALLDRKPRSLMRALCFVGPSNSGKSNLLRVMAGLLSDNPITTPLDTVEKSHGTQDFLRRAPWLLDEAFEQSKWQLSSVVKALLSGDAIGVNVKNGPMLTHSWRSATLWGTNSPPQFKEASRAMENRVLVVECKREFSSQVPVGVAAMAAAGGYSSAAEIVLAEETSGVLNWALVGLQRAWARGHFVPTAEMVESLYEMRARSNIATEFLDECTGRDPGKMVRNSDAYGAFAAWWQENRENRTIPSPDAFGRALVSVADPRVAISAKVLRRNGKRYYAGLTLNEDGLDRWQANYGATGVRGDTSQYSDSRGEVNSDIFPEWLELSIVKAMQRRHAS